MTNNDIAEKIKILEYHQKLLLKMVKGTNLKFDFLIVEKLLSQKEAGDILALCEKLSKDMKKQKAEGFVHFHPLFHELQAGLQPKLEAREVIEACVEQGLFLPLMLEMKKYC
ncbi:DUF1878 family protein [Bacillus sp. FJAT-27251]|uniref:DUF1878 family protein n=1 Tax=Bacillus sp. FJAT-27251 TaxID=1684142 RepID=UPI0006A77723|nr:DUF1878 family protein [Bacillus sp. FJAT-27251]